jgi:hypothetical protein
MLNKIIILVSFIFLVPNLSQGQFPARDSLWEKLTYINDTLKTSSANKLKLLLNIESIKNQSTNRQDSANAFLHMSIGKLCYEQGNYLKAVQYYQQSIHLINVNADKPWVNPGHVIISYYRLNVI